MNRKSLISIIFPAKNEGVNVKATLDSLFSVKTSYPFETIVVDDGSTDSCCNFISTYSQKDKIKLIRTNGVGAANARNIGANHAAGEVLIFCDSHLLFENGWMEGLVNPLEEGKTDAVTPGIASTVKPEIAGYGQSLSPDLSIKWNERQIGLFETAVVPGACLAIFKKVFEDVGGFETGFKTWGHEDVELSIKLWLFGYHCHVNPDVTILHVFRTVHPYQIRMKEVYYNLLRMAYSHFNENRIQKCRELMKPRIASQIERQVLQSNILQQRDKYLEKRKFDDNWYFKKFNINF
jgi:glycosyltransferase involved in cell wall biosynthesis